MQTDSVETIVTTRTAGGGRVQAVDAARAVAIVGMLAVNVGPRDVAGTAGALFALPHGRASLLFVVVAGVGISLLTRRERQSGASPRAGLRTRRWGTLLWRAALLLLGGLALQLLDHDVSVILQTYAVLFVVGGALVRVPDRLLLVLACVLMVLGPLTWVLAQLAAGTTYTLEPVSLAAPPGQVLHALLLSGPYPVVTWVAPFVAGMWIGRLELTARRTQHLLIVWGAVLAVAPLVLANLLVHLLGRPADEIGPDRLITSAPHGQMPLWLVSGAAAAALMLGLLLRATDVLDRWWWPLVAAGQLALTTYVAHLLVLAWSVRPGPAGLAEGVAVTAVMTVGLLILAPLWRARFRRGPLETLLRPPWSRSVA